MTFSRHLRIAGMVSVALCAFGATASASELPSISGYELRAHVEYRSAPEVSNFVSDFTAAISSVETDVKIEDLTAIAIERELFPTVADVEPAAAGLEAMNAVSTEWDQLIVVDPSSSHGWLVDQEGNIIKDFGVATGKGGLSSVPHSSGTPTGAHRVYMTTIGEAQEILKWKSRTGRIATNINTGTAHVTSALLALDGLEDSNQTSSYRNVYLHGTNIVDSIGNGSLSGGCVRLLPEVAIELATLAAAQDVETVVYILERPFSYLDSDSVD